MSKKLVEVRHEVYEISKFIPNEYRDNYFSSLEMAVESQVWFNIGSLVRNAVIYSRISPLATNQLKE